VVYYHNPHNPTVCFAGNYFALLEQFALVVDEAFMDFLPPDQNNSHQ